MARIGVSITKTTLFRGVQQEFSNVYYYDGLTVHPDVTAADAIIDEIANKEKTFHSTLVNFVKGRVWKQVGTATQNEMISQKNLSGTGATATVANMDKERAYLFRLRAGTDSRGNPVFLRKWYHACGSFDAAVGITAGILENTTAFSSGQRTTLKDRMASLGAITAGGGGVICSKSGRLATAGALWEAHSWLEHHQLGDMWRAT